MVVRGVHDGTLELADPALGERSLPVSEFRTIWAGRVGFAVEHR